MKRKSLVLFFLVVALTGCSTVSGTFNNEVVCAEGGKLRFISLYGPIGIAAKVDSSPIQCPGTTEGVKK